MAIESLASLRGHLQTAIEIEHATLPPYLCALYSIAAPGNAEAAEVIQSVAMEEMLHLTLAANLLNAIGGEPVLDAPALLPGHPSRLPHSGAAVEVSIGPLSPEALELFMAIERPGSADAPPEDDAWETLGQFYAAIREALTRLSSELGEAAVFCGDPERQVTDALYYGGAGAIIAVTDLASALRALEEIVEQGEGLDHGSILDGDRDMFHPEREEIAHYFRFHELAQGRRYRPGDTPESGPTGEPVAVDWSAVAPMRRNLRADQFAAGSDVRIAIDAFNRCYCDVLRLLELVFNGRPELLSAATGAMYGIRQQAIDLMALDVGDGCTAGPSFEWVAPEDRRFENTRIAVLPGGPYLVSGDVAMYETDGTLHKRSGPATLCRCGGSRSKPFCDGTHARIDFRSDEHADHGRIEQRRRAYTAPDGVTIYDDRSRCAHFGQCTDRLAVAFGVSDEAFVDPTAAPSAQLIDVAAGCPSGALSFTAAEETEAIERHEAPSVHPIPDGPYRVRGGVEVVGADGRPYEIRERQTLCRCGQSRNKPFCDGSHWYAGFRDPAPPELAGPEPFPWTDPDAAARGRERYAEQLRAQAAGQAASRS